MIITGPLVQTVFLVEEICRFTFDRDPPAAGWEIDDVQERVWDGQSLEAGFTDIESDLCFTDWTMGLGLNIHVEPC